MSELLRDERLKNYIIELNQEQLYDRGVDSEGKDLGRPGYSDYTIEIKKKKGQRYDHVTLKDTGRFYKSFRIRVNKDGFTIDAKAPGKPDLYYRYGVDILGMDDVSQLQFSHILVSKLHEQILENIL